MSFLGIYRATYAYVPQNDQELAIDENDLLYLLEKSEVDDWWTVKKRVVGADAEEPVGLVPSNYITPADAIGSARALYDYDRQTDEELSFKENDEFQVYDDKDPDWILVSKSQEYGFVPANYIEMRSGGDATTAVAPVTQSQPLGSFPPPPSHPTIASTTAKAKPEPVLQPPPQRYDRPTSSANAEPEYDNNDEEEAPPALPSKPRPQSVDQGSRRYSSDKEEAPPPKPSRPSAQEGSSSSKRFNDDVGELFTWSVSEVDGRKKKKAMLAIGNGNIYFSPDSVNGGSPQQWRAQDLLSFSSEKKHVFLEFKDPLYSLEIHAGTNEVAAQILSVLGDLKGSVSQKGLKEIKDASSSKSSKKQTGKILFNFDAEGADELTVREGDSVTIINNTKSNDWWLVQNTVTGKAGVVPAQFVEPLAEEKTKSSLVSKFKLSRSKSKDNLKKAKQEEEQRSKLSLPKSSRVRTWEDRSGTFRVDAEFLGVVEGKIHLHKTNGVKIAVDAGKLSLADLEFVERVTGMSLESYKSKRGSSKDTGESDRERRARKERERKRRERDEQERDRIRYEREKIERVSEREKLERERDRKERELERREREMDKEERDRLRYELADAKKKLADMASKDNDYSRSASRDRSSSRAVSSSKKEEYDWFEFFLEAGVDVNQCQRYSNNFSNEQIDPSILESIDASVLRTLGLREGDIIRVTKYIDQKYDRQQKTTGAGASSTSNGGLFTDSTGALKVNRPDSADQVVGSLPSPTKTAAQAQAQPTDDDAWTVKPAVKAEVSNASLQSQFTGSMQDLVNLKPLEPTKTASSAKSFAPTPATPVKPIEPVKTGTIVSQPTGLAAQATGALLDPFKTGGGNILPLATGGIVYLPIQQTGIIGLQPTILPLQKTGGLAPALTGGLVPLQKTGGLAPALTGGLVPLQKTGGLVPLQKTGGMNPALTGGLVPLQRTGGINPALTGGLLPLQRTGGLPQTSFGQSTGLPQTSFGQSTGLPQTSFGTQMTGGLPQTSFGAQMTGGLPQTSFGAQMTGGLPQTSFGAQMTGVTQPAFGAQQMNQLPTTSFGVQNTGFQQQQQLPFGPNSTGYSLSSPPTFNTSGPIYGQQMNNLTTSFQSAAISTPFVQQQQPQQLQQQPFGQQQQQPFGQQQQPFGQQQQPFGQQQQQPFGQQQFGQQPFGQPQTSFGQAPALFNQQPPQQMPQATFGGYSQQQPLEAQPTGYGFGNTPSNDGSKKADLSRASADNPFGF